MSEKLVEADKAPDCRRCKGSERRQAWGDSPAELEKSPSNAVAHGSKPEAILGEVDRTKLEGPPVRVHLGRTGDGDRLSLSACSWNKAPTTIPPRDMCMMHDAEL